MDIGKLIGVVIFAVGLYLFSNFDILMPTQKTGIVLLVIGLTIALIKK